MTFMKEPQKPKVEKSEEESSVQSQIWMILLFIILTAFINSEIGKENVKKIIIDCGSPILAVKNDTRTTYGSRALVSCLDGHYPTPFDIVCQDNGQWSEATCEPLDCGTPDIENGDLQFDSTTFNSSATVICKPGYQPSQATVTCMVTGEWETAQCIDVNECDPNPCINNGECSDKVNGYTCQCKKWFCGDRCEIDKRPCTNHNCKNGGTCNPQDDGTYKCSCVSGFEGAFCTWKHATNQHTHNPDTLI